MNKIIVVTFTSLLCLFANVTSTFSQDSFIISGNPYAPPVVWEEQRNLSGVAPELVKEIFSDLHIGFSTRVISDWQKVQDKARAGEIDLIVSAYKNDTRAEYLNFSVPYLPQPTVIVVEKGKEFKFSSWDSLKGKKGVTGIGESYGQEFDDFIKNNLDVDYYQLERSFNQLNLGKADYLIIDLYTALIYARLLNGEDQITILDPPVTIQDFHLAVQKDSALNGRLEEINSKLEEKLKNGEIAELFMKQFDRWKMMIERQSKYLSKYAGERTADQQAYLEKQDIMARDRITGLIVDREGLPSAAQ